MTDDLQTQITEQEQALLLAQRADDLKKQLKICENLGSLYSDSRNYADSVRYYQQASQLAEQLKSVSYLFRIGLALSVLHENTQAIDCLKQAFEIGLTDETTERDALRAIYFLGETYKNFLDDIPQATDCYQQTLELAQKINLSKQQYWALRRLGECSEKSGNTQQAIRYYEQALTIVRQEKDQHDEANLLTDLANIFAKTGDQSQMTSYFEQALAIANASKDSDAIMNVLIWWGHAYRDLEEPAKALDYYQQTLALAGNQKDNAAVSHILTIIAHFFENQNDLPQAIAYYHQILNLSDTDAEDAIKEIAQKSKRDFNYTTALASLAEIYERKNDIPQALDYLEQAVASTTLPASVWRFNEQIARLGQNLNPHQPESNK